MIRMTKNRMHTTLIHVVVIVWVIADRQMGIPRIKLIASRLRDREKAALQRAAEPAGWVGKTDARPCRQRYAVQAANGKLHQLVNPAPTDGRKGGSQSGTGLVK